MAHMVQGSSEGPQDDMNILGLGTLSPKPLTPEPTVSYRHSYVMIRLAANHEPPSNSDL